MANTDKAAEVVHALEMRFKLLWLVANGLFSMFEDSQTHKECIDCMCGEIDDHIELLKKLIS